MLFAAILHFPGNASHSSWWTCLDDQKELWEYLDTSLTVYEVKQTCGRVSCGRTRAQNWGDKYYTAGIRNVLCTTSSSNFWTQRAFCSSANKYLWAAFSDAAKNRCTLVREVRILFSWKLQPYRPPQIHIKISIFTLWSCLLGSLSSNLNWADRCFSYHSLALDSFMYI